MHFRKKTWVWLRRSSTNFICFIGELKQKENECTSFLKSVYKHTVEDGEVEGGLGSVSAKLQKKEVRQKKVARWITVVWFGYAVKQIYFCVINKEKWCIMYRRSKVLITFAQKNDLLQLGM